MARNEVTECICYKRSFKEIERYAREHGISSVEELQERDYCSNSCRLCVPYVEITLETGQTVFSPGEPFRKKRNSA